jgi:hypothetical protein
MAMPDVGQAKMLARGALVFEYVDIAKALKNLRSICRSNGIPAALLQLPKERTASVSPSPFVALKGLNSIMRLVPQLITLASGKQFSLQLFKLPEKH